MKSKENEKPSGTDIASSEIAAEYLAQIIGRLERYDEEKAEILEAMREIMGEAKGQGFDPVIIRKILKLRKMDRDKAREEDELLELYKKALGMEE